MVLGVARNVVILQQSTAIDGQKARAAKIAQYCEQSSVVGSVNSVLEKKREETSRTA